MYELNKKNIEDMAIATITEVWGQINWDKVTGTRAMGIWDEYTSKIKATAMTTNSYEKFIEKLCRKMDVRSLKFKNIFEISQQDERFKKLVLKALREETQIIVLKLRLNNQVRKEEYEQKKAREEKSSNSQISFANKGAEVHEN